ncbi:hypothetical protein KDW_44170 [Dictyobacter vulcani]|uniref:Uncharacterized protein n=1 Tax=Dictyobacter vulcani TaxID=2607529 RepID=A0A5J4KQV5_9CHLR|nr:hypothetical protein [Dictyobacter vulcani]GER90255.1 hypothetical protein KDW_44170 [Dictyobacter vulcani]
MLQKDRSIWFLRLETLAIIGVLFFFLFTNYLQNRLDLSGKGGVVYLFIAAGLVVISVNHEHYWKRLSQQRLAAAVQSEQYLADEQPEPDISVLAVPIKISMRPRKRLWLLWSVAGGILGVLLVGSMTFFIRRGQMDSINSGLELIEALVVVVLFGIVINSTHDFCPTIQLNAEGITAHSLLRHTFLAWSDVRLFAKYYTPVSALSMQRLQVYELSGEQAFIHWSWSMFSSSWWYVQVNGQPMDRGTYLDFVQNFSQVVRGYTNLPLCELTVSSKQKP